MLQSLGARCVVWSAVLAALGCGVDDRKLNALTEYAAPADADASVSPPVPDGPGGPLSGAPVLGVEPERFDFGPAVMGLPSRGRVSVVNTGDAPLTSPVAVLLPTSDADVIILHDQCDNDVEPSARCDVRIQLVPSKVGAVAATLGVQSSGQSAEAAITGSGLQAGPLTLAPGNGSSADFGGVALNTTAEAVFVVSNPTQDPSGPLTVSVNEGQFQVLAPTEGDCQPGTTVLADGQRCQVRVAFSPVRRGGVDASLVVSSALGGTSVPLAGVGRVPAVLSTPDALDFGGVVLQSVGLRTVRVENAGDEPLRLSGVSLAAEASPADAGAAAPSSFSVQNSDCGEGTLIAGGDHCTVTLGFRPLTAETNQQTQLIVSAANSTARNVALSGSGLPQGALEIAPAAGSAANFGELPVGQSLSQQFVVTNPSAQPSGLLELSANDDFSIAPSTTDGDCESGVTSLVNGESCALRVTFTPSDGGRRDGSLLVTSVLAGAAHLPVAGRGLSRPRLDLARSELDFGRVPTEAPVQQTLTVFNRGDQPLSSVQTTLEALGGGPAAAFSLLGSCSGVLSASAPCELALEFLPTEAANYTALLRLTSDAGGSASLLLLGRAFPRGSLVVEAAGDASTDFGDVALGSSRAVTFTLTNPGTVPSGRLTLSTNSNAFALDEGDCNPEGSPGLVNGSSCTFSVAFTPVTSDPLTVSLSVQSPGAGETSLSLTGRGRVAATLTATGNRDFGSANVNEDALTDPLNQFSWTVRNGGDLESGPLQVVNDNPAEFIVSSDTCTDVNVPGQGTCAMDIRFRPSATGARTASLTVTDPGSEQALVLAMTGNGVLIAQPGESCVNAACASGVCTGGVCCDRACNGSCQACSTSGVCEDQDARQACGNGAGACFGVDRCLLPETEACSGDDQCGSGNCERRLNSQTPSDQICCLAACPTGQQCNAQTGLCQLPTLGAGAACGAAGQPTCGTGLECKTCLGGGRQCTPSAACCGGCDDDYECIGGACACPPDATGRPQLDCQNGQCIVDQDLACCDSAPQCPARAPVCDGTAGLCRECLQAGDCPVGATGTFRSCNNFRCVYACSTQQGFRDCQGSCISGSQCCADADCGPCGSCGGNACRSLADGQPGRCSGGQACRAGACQDVCPDNTQFVNGACRRNPGQPCSVNGDCAGNDCLSWAVDRDGDGYGSDDPSVNNDSVTRCGAVPPPPLTAGPFVVVNAQRPLDCCDTSTLVNPGQTEFLVTLGTTADTCSNRFDVNCDGRIETQFGGTEFFDCEGPVNVPCNQRSGILVGSASFLGITAADLTDQTAVRSVCGNSSAQYNVCRASGTTCVNTPALRPLCR